LSPAVLAPLALAAALAVLVWPAFAHAFEVWSSDEEFNYGYLIVPIAIGIVWWRRHELRSSVSTGRRSGLALVGLGVLLLLVSRRSGIHAIGGLAVPPLFIGVAAYLWGWGTARVLAFPSLYLLFGLGLYRGLLSTVGFGLQHVTAHGAEFTSTLIGLDVERDGLVLQSADDSPAFAFVVAEACSGMSSLLSLLALAALWIYAARGTLSARMAVMLSVVPIVVLANTVRVTLVLLIATWYGQDAALGFFHGASSLALFVMALVSLLFVSRVVGCKLPPLATSS
jgi:exosortase